MMGNSPASKTALALVLAGAFWLCLTGIAAPRGEDDPVTPEYAFVVTTDYYTAGYYSTIEILPPRNTSVSIEPVSTDAVAHYDRKEDMVFVVNRFLADNIQIVSTCPPLRTTGQYSVGNGSNPHDIRLADSGKAYVSRYEWNSLLVVHPYSGDSLGVVDLASFADADGIPEMDRMEIVGERLFVTLNAIDRTTWLPDGPGRIAVIDVRADTLVDCDPDMPGVQPITMHLPNPYTELRYDPWRDELYVGCLGAWGVLDGGVEIIDPYALESRGVLASEEDLGGDVSDVVLAPDGKAYAVVLDAAPWPDNFARLVRFDQPTGTVTDTLFRQTSGLGSSLAGIELNRQLELYLCDRDLTGPGIRIFDTRADTLVASIDVGLPPLDITFIQPPLDSVGGGHPDPENPGRIKVMTYPNPFVSSTTIAYEVSGPGTSSIRLDIFDIRGRRIRSLTEKASAAAGSIDWDGTDGSGKQVGPGLYLCRIECDGVTAVRKILSVR